MQNTGYMTEFLILILVLVALGIVYYYSRRYRKPAGGKDNYISALESVVDGEFRKAIQKFKEVIRENSENINAYLRLGDLLRERGLAQNALKIHRDLTLRTGLRSDIQLKVQHSLMLDFEALGEYKYAAETARKLLEKDNVYNKEASNKLLNYLEKDQKWDEAFSAAKRYNKPIPPHLVKKMAIYLVVEGLSILDKGEGRDARIKFKEAIKLSSSCSAAFYYLGKSYYVENRLEDAIREWKNLCKNNPDQAYLVFNLLERAWFELGKFTEAESLYNEILINNSENLPAALALAEIYNKKGEHDNALELLDRAEEIKPDNPTIASLRIQILHNKNQYKTASSYALDFFRNKITDSTRKFTCQECHYQTNEPLWICPQCKSIDTFDI